MSRNRGLRESVVWLLTSVTVQRVIEERYSRGEEWNVVLYTYSVHRWNEEEREGTTGGTFSAHLSSIQWNIWVGDIFLAVTTINQINVSLSFFPLLFSWHPCLRISFVHACFRCALASLYEGVSVRPSVRLSVRYQFRKTALRTHLFACYFFAYQAVFWLFLFTSLLSSQTSNDSKKYCSIFTTLFAIPLPLAHQPPLFALWNVKVSPHFSSIFPSLWTCVKCPLFLSLSLSLLLALLIYTGWTYLLFSSVHCCLPYSSRCGKIPAIPFILLLSSLLLTLPFITLHYGWKLPFTRAREWVSERASKQKNERCGVCKQWNAERVNEWVVRANERIDKRVTQ